MGQPAQCIDSVVWKEIKLARFYPCVLALGAFLKNTVCVIQGNRAYLSHDIGNLDTPEAIRGFEDSIKRLLMETGVTPVCVAHDLHPDFPSTRHAYSMGLPTLAVQHHHAHAGALAAEHGLEHPFLCLILDGFGLGPGNQSWGGELFLVSGAGYERKGHLLPLKQPGGDKASREPWRMAAGVLHMLGRGDEIAGRFGVYGNTGLLTQSLERNINCPETSSGGRLFDAVCGLLNLRPIADFEGQAPMELEALVRSPGVMEGGWTIDDGAILDLRPLLNELADMKDPSQGANLFHGTLAAALSDWVERAAVQSDCKDVALGGGCFLNRVLLEGVTHRLEQKDIRVFAARNVSPGDCGLSLGQAWIAAHAVEAQ